MIDVNHIAKLARIGLSKEELKKLEGELSAILGFGESERGLATLSGVLDW